MQPPSAPSRARLRIGPRTAVLLVLLALAAAELALSRRGYGDTRLVRGDERLGYALLGDQVVEGPRGTVERINADGFRERDWHADPPGRPLVVVLGHSLSYGVGVDAGERWAAHLEAGLRGAGAVRASVLVLALPGYTLEQMCAVHADVARALEPDVVVVDVGEYSVRPMVRITDPANIPLGRWIRRTALWDFLRRRISRARNDHARMQGVLDDPTGSDNDALWARAFERLDGLRDELDARSTRLVLLHTPSAAAVLASEPPTSRWSDWCAERPQVLEVDCRDALREAMGPLAAELAERDVDPSQDRWRVERLDPADFEARDSACFFLDDPQHLTRRGHAVVGEHVAARLAPLLVE